MKIIKTEIPDVLIIKPDVYRDNRGYFFEVWNENEFKKAGITNHWIQDNESKSSYLTIRGLHYQEPPYTQAKLVRVIKGTVIDVAVDIRKDSPTYGKHVAVELSHINKKQLYIPRGFAHGFIVRSNQAIFCYKCDNIYMPSAERGIKYNDKTLAIDWGVEGINEEVLPISDKDKKLPTFKNIKPIEIERN